MGCQCLPNSYSVIESVLQLTVFIIRFNVFLTSCNINLLKMRTLVILSVLLVSCLIMAEGRQVFNDFEIEEEIEERGSAEMADRRERQDEGECLDIWTDA